MISGKTAGEIFEQIRLAVQSGALHANDTLPPVRELATTLDVNRNTVALAYKRLVAAGIAESKGRNGTVIRSIAHDAPQEGTPPGLALTDLAGGNPSTSLLPDIRKVLGRVSATPRLYGEPPVEAALEEYGRAWLGQDIDTGFALTLSNGAVDGVERILSSHLIKGDRVAVEDPCFLSSINTLKNNRLVPVAVPMDEEGMCADALSGALARGVQAIIITPRAHNPTGWSLSAARAEHIRALLAQYPQVLVIIDDHFSLLSDNPYQHVIPQETQRWALIRSTSKFLGPDMRLAFIASDTDTAQRLALRLNAGSSWVSHILQDIVLASLKADSFDATIASTRETYRMRRETLVNLLKADGIPLSESHDGLNIWVPLPRESTPVVMALAKYGWLVREGEIFALKQASHGIRITVSDMSGADATTFTKKLAQLLAPYFHSS